MAEQSNSRSPGRERCSRAKRATPPGTGILGRRHLSCSRCIVSCSDAATLLAGGRLTATATRSAATSDATANGGDAAAVVAHRASAARRAHAHIGGESPGRMQTSLLLSLIEMDELAVPLQKQRTFMWPPCEVVDCPAPSRRSMIPATTRRGRGCLRGLHAYEGFMPTRASAGGLAAEERPAAKP